MQTHPRGILEVLRISQLHAAPFHDFLIFSLKHWTLREEHGDNYTGIGTRSAGLEMLESSDMCNKSWYSHWMNAPQKVALIILFVALMVLAALYFMMPKTSPISAQQPTDTITAVFTCEGNKSITAAFTQNSVHLQLSDGRTMSLPQAISADGGRYANSDESFVFWNKGNGALITENGTTTFSNCSTPNAN